MIKLETLTTGHVEECFKRGFINKDTADRLAIIPPGKHAAMRNGAMLAIGGITEIWPGVGAAWLAVMPGAKKHPRRLLECAFALLDEACDELNLHRIHAEVKSNDLKAQRVAYMLGFEYESTMKHYGPDKSDYDMMTWQR